MSEENKVTGKTNRIFAARGGFTLIELLVVIILIAILSGMSVVVIRMAIGGGKASAVQMQLHQVSMALDNYKTKVGEYPPDFSDPVAVMRHIKKRWPRSDYGTTVADFNTFCSAIATKTASITGSTASQWDFTRTVDTLITNPADNSVKIIQPEVAYVSALVLWLGGLPDNTGTPAGFYLSPTDPFGFSASDVSQREEMFFKFPEKSIVLNEHKVPAFLINNYPVVYFSATNRKSTQYVNENNTQALGAYAFPMADDKDAEYNGHDDYHNLDYNTNTGLNRIDIYTKHYVFPDGIAVPYGRENGQWCEQDRFQLVHPGGDGQFSDPAVQTNVSLIRIVDTQTNMTSFDDDNVTNFSKGATLSSEY